MCYNQTMEKIYDVLILGGGVAGMSAAIYAKRAGKSVAIIEKAALGGQVLQLEKIENFPSQTIVDGLTLASMFSKQIKSLDVEILRDEILFVDFSNENKLMKGRKGIYCSKKVIIATGIKSRELGVGESQLLGQGVSFCAVCDGNFFKEKEVCVASKHGSGIMAARYLCNVASKVTLLDSEDMSIFAAASKNEKIEIVSKCKINDVKKDDFGVCINAEIGGKNKTFSTAALFVELGKIPATKLFEGVIELDQKGYIITDENLQTSVAGVYAAGDVRNGKMKQIVTACADGALAAGGA